MYKREEKKNGKDIDAFSVLPSPLTTRRASGLRLVTAAAQWKPATYKYVSWVKCSTLSSPERD